MLNICNIILTGIVPTQPVKTTAHQQHTQGQTTARNNGSSNNSWGLRWLSANKFGNVDRGKTIATTPIPLLK